MKIQKASLIFVYISGMAIVIGGCAGQKSGQEKKIALTFVSTAHPSYDEIRNTQCENFNKKFSDAEVKFIPISGQGYFSKVTTMIGGGTSPDIFYMEEMYLPEFARRGTLLDLNTYVEKDKDFVLSEFFPIVLKAYTYAGKLYGLSENFQPLIMYYNRKMFERTGLPYPDKNLTWDGFLETALRLTKKDKNENVVQFGAVMPYIWDMVYRHNGGRVFSEDGQKCILNNPIAIETMNFIRDFYAKYHVIPQPREQREQGLYETFAAQRAALFIGHGGRWYTVPLREIKDLRWGVAHLPKGKTRGAPVASHAFVISSTCKHKDIAWEFLKDITGLEGQKYIVKTGDAIPTLKSLTRLDSFLFDPDFPDETENIVHIEALDYAYLAEYPREISYQQMGDITAGEFDLFYLGKKSAEDTLKTVEERINRLIGESKSSH